ncbi:unnamed protein product [Caretta caretta]
MPEVGSGRCSSRQRPVAARERSAEWQGSCPLVAGTLQGQGEVHWGSRQGLGEACGGGWQGRGRDLAPNIGRAGPPGPEYSWSLGTMGPYNSPPLGSGRSGRLGVGIQRPLVEWAATLMM